MESEARTVEALQREGLIGTRKRSASARLRWLAPLLSAAAALAIGLGVGRTLPPAPVEEPAAAASTAPDARPAFLLLLHDSPSFQPTVSHEALVEEYSQWAGELAREGRLVEASELAPGGRTLGAEDEGAVSEVGGFFLIHAADEGEALAIAGDCPHLRYGGQVEVRAVRG